MLSGAMSPQFLLLSFSSISYLLISACCVACQNSLCLYLAREMSQAVLRSLEQSQLLVLFPGHLDPWVLPVL